VPLLFHDHPSVDEGATRAWITAIAPTPEDIARLTDELGFDAEMLEHALDPNERPRLRSRGETTLVILRVPNDDPSAAVPYVTVPLGFVLTKQTGLTICAHDLPIVQKLAEHAESDVARRHRYRLIIRGLELSADTFLDAIDRMNQTIDGVEGRLARSLENREVLELLRFQKSFVFMTAALDGMRLMVERLQKTPIFHIEPEDEGWLDDVLVEFRQAQETCTVSRNVLSEMMDAFASIISNNLNVVMKFLAAATVILTFPVLVASFYGMNMELPGQHSPHAFIVASLASVGVALVVSLYFKKQRWL